ncbi:MAG: efflux RND transporter periplasmic adaptor subunit [Brachymonas sp.]|nr:efflux RND transporter periplasmic adaptor subunit [Brachymonas sp.]
MFSFSPSFVGRPARTAAGALALVTLLAACGDKKQGPSGPPPAPEVGVVTVQPGTVTLGTELPGRLEASRVAEVRARAAGILLKRHFREGSEVKAGQTLFTIDPGPYRTAYDAAQANHAQAAALARRYRPLVEANAISKQEYDAAVSAEKATRAQLEAARINLGYSTVKAPISGRIGREMVTEGALVGQGQATHLATIQQTNPLFVNLSQSANDVMQLRQALKSGSLAAAGGVGESARVEVVLENGQPYEHPGRLLFTDLTVDPTTGQVSLRAEVPNPEQMLLPGMYVRVRLQQAQVDNAILLPQQAVTRGTQADTVLVVGADNSIAPRPVKISQAQGNDWVVVDGLKPGEKVVVDGFMRLRPGVTKVTPVYAKAQPAIPAAAASAPPAATAASAPAPAASAAASQ